MTENISEGLEGKVEEHHVSFGDFRLPYKENAVNLYDWRKGRSWIIPAEKRSKDIEDWEDVYQHLEATEEEKEWWRKTMEEVKANKSVYCKTLTYLMHPELGRIIALLTLKRVEILEREGIWNIDHAKHSYAGKKVEAEYMNFWQSGNKLIEDIANKTLDGEIPTREWLKSNNVENETYESIAWHGMIQGKDIQAMPYLPLIPEEEAIRAIDAYYEEKLAWVKQEKGK